MRNLYFRQAYGMFRRLFNSSGNLVNVSDILRQVRYNYGEDMAKACAYAWIMTLGDKI